MTIKRRLFISNILMLIIPVLLSIMIVSGTLYVVIEITGIQGRGPTDANEDLFYVSKKRVDVLVDKWSQDMELEKMKADVSRFNDTYGNRKLSLGIYREKTLLYPAVPAAESPVLNLALEENGTHVYVMDTTAVYRKIAGEYSIVLVHANFERLRSEPSGDYSEPIFNLGMMMLLFIIAVILLTNRFLTQFIFKRIITPLDTLVYGVHQIRDGNLDYRIEYAGKDEFTGICSDFNEMAQRLLDSVNARQKDEANRKELIAGISHDLRTPLTSIKAYVEGIEKGVASTPETQKRYLDTIKNKTNDLEHIVNQLFLFSKLDIGEFPFYLEKVNIGFELSNMMAAIVEEYERKGLMITVTRNVQDVYVQADIVQLRRAVINVLENSVKYKNKEQGNMTVSCRADDRFVTIRLADDGPGVTVEALQKLFDIFYRSDPSRSNPSKGSGLGLAITAKIIERLGGSIRAENVPEGGLAIVMELPKYTGG